MRRISNLEVSCRDNTCGIFEGQYGRFLQANTGLCSVTGMKKRALTSEEQQEALALRALYDHWARQAQKSQEEVGDLMGMSQGAVGHYLRGRNALNVKVAAKFADILGCDVADFSPRLARELEALASQRKVAARLSAAPPGYSPVPIVGTTASGPLPGAGVNDGGTDTADVVFAKDPPPRAYALIMSAAHAALHSAIATTSSALIIDPGGTLQRSALLALEGDSAPMWFRIDALTDELVRGADYLRPQVVMEIPRKALAYAHAVVGFVP